MLKIATYIPKKIILVAKDATHTSQISRIKSYHTNVKILLMFLKS